MLRSMYSGISGMRGFQTKLDVIGNNIANVNTSGFKKGRLTFQDMMSQTTRGAQGAVGGRGGVNPMQVGLGSKTGSIDNIHTQGFLQSTGRPLDIAIEGEGMFVVGTGNITGEDDAIGDGSRFYTRAGNFYLDDQGYIVNADGYYLLGYKTDADGKPNIGEQNFAIKVDPDSQSFSISKNGQVNIVDDKGNPVELENTKTIKLVTFSNPEGLEKQGGNLYQETGNSGTPTPTSPGEGGAGDLISNSLEMSNVDLAEEFTEMIVAQRGFQANTRIITTSDEILQELVNLKR